MGVSIVLFSYITNIHLCIIALEANSIFTCMQVVFWSVPLGNMHIRYVFEANMKIVHAMYLHYATMFHASQGKYLMDVFQTRKWQK